MSAEKNDEIGFDLDLSKPAGQSAPPGTLARLFPPEPAELERYLTLELEAIVRQVPLHLYAATWRARVQEVLRQLDLLRGVVP